MFAILKSGAFFRVFCKLTSGWRQFYESNNYLLDEHISVLSWIQKCVADATA